MGALVTLSGFPSSGKTTRANELRAFFEARMADPTYTGKRYTVRILNDDILNISRNVYDDSRTEKPARGSMFSNVTRCLTEDSIVIVDGMNYIKGFRYQMYCQAIEVQARVCTVHVATSGDKCREWNASRTETAAYKPKTLDELLMRYEEPSSMTRWDSPLFTLSCDEADGQFAAIWDAVTSGRIKPPNGGTTIVQHAAPNYLQLLESTTAQLVSSILAAQADRPGGGRISVLLNPAPGAGSPVRLSVTLPPRNVTLSQLQRTKRQFSTIHKQAGAEMTPAKLGECFLEYVEGALR
uniref:Chromatin associated protein KTI12 n=1 Tax=Bartheletia paradoxa TaxID=669517 RepID=A0A2D0XHU6_9BASI|nr:hypothetical protein SPAR01690 [Bartheletia paradoxa]